MTIGVPMNGTRTRQGFALEHPPSAVLDRSVTRDVGLLGNVTASITFVNSATKQLQAANGTFPAASFPVGVDIIVNGTNLNDGTFRVTANDAVNGAFLTVDNSPKNEGPITATVRTA